MVIWSKSIDNPLSTRDVLSLILKVDGLSVFQTGDISTLFG